jgi:PAP2 superfamily
VSFARFCLVLAVAVTVSIGALGATNASAATPPPEQVLRDWYGLVLKLVRHTPTYSPPVASRAFAYLGVTAFEAVASGTQDLGTLAGQLNGLKAGPKRENGKIYNDAVVLDAAMSAAAQAFFENTGPTGQRAMAALEVKVHADVSAGVPSGVVARSEAYGRSVAAHILAWSQGDGGAVVENLGFPLQYALIKGPGHWTPTSLIALQQTPLLPNWGKTRTFALKDGTACPLPPPPEYSEDKASEFYKQAQEVFDIKKNLSPEQRAIARFWSDDPMLSPTPPGHWISIALQILERDKRSLTDSADVLTRVGIAEADAFIGCWNTKYQYDLLRPVTYIRRLMDPKWESAMTTPPFPEYPSGHSTQSGAAAAVLTQFFGENFAFEDATHTRDGLPSRKFASFQAAAEEAALSRLYGGIHFRAAIERGLDQGKCIGKAVNALRTKR